VCNSLNRNKGSGKEDPTLSTSPCLVQWGLLLAWALGGEGTLGSSWVLMKFVLWDQGRILWSSLIRSLAHTHPRPMGGEQKGTCWGPGPPTRGTSRKDPSADPARGTDVELWLFFAPSRWGLGDHLPSHCFSLDAPTSPHAFPPARLLSVGKYRSFLLPHFSHRGKGSRRNVPISICIEIAPTPP